MAPFEGLVNASIGDLYCVHQRGMRMAFATFALFGGAFFTPVVVGKMTTEMGWRWPFWFIAIFSGVVLPLVRKVLVECWTLANGWAVGGAVCA